LITGSIWGKPTWNTWWTWDPKLISFAILLLILISYLMLRTFEDEQNKEAADAAVLAIIARMAAPAPFQPNSPDRVRGRRFRWMMSDALCHSRPECISCRLMMRPTSRYPPTTKRCPSVCYVSVN
jgi:hypothetical protein